MIVDVVFVIILILAIIKGYQRGLIVGAFSFIAIIVGLAAALKLSVVTARYIGKSVKISDEWLPVIAFVLVFLIVVLLVRVGAKFIQRAAEIALLGWVNRLGGTILYLALYTAIFSVFLFYVENLNLLKADTINKSVTYFFVEPWGPKIINAFGTIIPFFRNMFNELENFFEGITHKISVL